MEMGYSGLFEDPEGTQKKQSLSIDSTTLETTVSHESLARLSMWQEETRQGPGQLRLSSSNNHVVTLVLSFGHFYSLYEMVTLTSTQKWTVLVADKITLQWIKHGFPARSFVFLFQLSILP